MAIRDFIQERKKPTLKTVYAHVPSDLHEKVLYYLGREKKKTSMKQLVEASLRAYIAECEKETK